jgi:hypothetical protein
MNAVIISIPSSKKQHPQNETSTNIVFHRDFYTYFGPCLRMMGENLCSSWLPVCTTEIHPFLQGKLRIHRMDPRELLNFARCPSFKNYLQLSSISINHNWLVVWIINGLFFHFIYGMSSFPLTNSYFSRWVIAPPTRWTTHIYNICLMVKTPYLGQPWLVCYQW